MDVKHDLKRQYKAGLKMLRQCIELAPADVWVSGEHPRTFWRIAYHALFYTHFYLFQKEDDLVPWEQHVIGVTDLWPEAKPEVLPPFSQADMLVFLDRVFGQVDQMVDALDLDSDETGFPWYKGMGKLEHQMVNLRHLGVHYGQLSELLMSHGIDTDWVSKA